MEISCVTDYIEYYLTKLYKIYCKKNVHAEFSNKCIINEI